MDVRREVSRATSERAIPDASTKAVGAVRASTLAKPIDDRRRLDEGRRRPAFAFGVHTVREIKILWVVAQSPFQSQNDIGSVLGTKREFASPCRSDFPVLQTTHQKDVDMAKGNTPEKPPTNREASIAGKGLPKGNLSKSQAQTLSGRVLSERGASKPKGK